MREAWGRFSAFLFVMGLAVTCYLAARSSGAMTDFGWVPAAFTDWADTHDTWRHSVGFVVLSFLGFLLRAPFVYLHAAAQPGAQCRSGFQAFNLVFFLILAFFLEWIQLWIPSRNFNLSDIYAGWIGVGAAWLLVVWLPGVLWGRAGR